MRDYPQGARKFATIRMLQMLLCAAECVVNINYSILQMGKASALCRHDF